jgi:hypothetical protein
MLILRAPSGASERLAHAIELINRDLGDLVARLDKHQQAEFWSDLDRYAQEEQLVVSEHVNTAVREALDIADEKLTTHLRPIDDDERSRVRQMLHEACEQQLRQTKQPKARHGGGSSD